MFRTATFGWGIISREEVRGRDVESEQLLNAAFAAARLQTEAGV